MSEVGAYAEVVLRKAGRLRGRSDGSWELSGFSSAAQSLLGALIEGGFTRDADSLSRAIRGRDSAAVEAVAEALQTPVVVQRALSSWWVKWGSGWVTIDGVPADAPSEAAKRAIVERFAPRRVVFDRC